MPISSCGLCKSRDLVLAIDLGLHPLADTFLKKEQLMEPEMRYPLQMLLCKACGHAMNSYVVSEKKRYQENDYSYDSNNSKISIKHFTDMAGDVCRRAQLSSGDLVIDIGSNVGTLLQAFKNQGMEIRGVEPSSNIADIAEKNGIPTIRDFFNTAACAEILKTGKAKVVTITNAFNHISYLDEFMQCVVSILRDDGTFVIEIPYFLQLLKRRHFDTIYLEHVSYIAVKPLAAYVKKFGLNIIHVEENDYMSGSIRFFIGRGKEGAMVQKMIANEEGAKLFSPQTYEEFGRQIMGCKLTLLKELVDARAKGGKVVAIGAATKGNTLLNYCGIDNTLIDFVTESSELKIGKYLPGSHIPILPDDAIDESVTHALILAWNIADFLKEKIGPKFPKLIFITPHVVA